MAYNTKRGAEPVLQRTFVAVVDAPPGVVRDCRRRTARQKTRTPDHPGWPRSPVRRRGQYSVAPLDELAGGDQCGRAAATTMTSASMALTLSTSTSGSEVHCNGSGVKVTSTPPTVIVT